MWKATKRNKIPVLLAQALRGETEASDVPTPLADAWRKVAYEGEDTLTSTVFERLAYLPGDLGLRLLVRAARVSRGKPVKPEAILSSEAWPSLKLAGDEKREPDWLFETSRSWWLIEAKWKADAPTAQQLGDQLEALQRAPNKPLKPVVQVAIVRRGTPGESRSHAFLDVTWADLRTAVAEERRPELALTTQRILDDILAALDARGLDRRYLDTLVGWPGPSRDVMPAFADERDVRPSEGDHMGSPLRDDNGDCGRRNGRTT